MIKRIEVDFAIPVNLTAQDEKSLCALIQKICKDNTPEGMVHWQFGQGNKPTFSQADAKFLGKSIDTTAPLYGEPTFNSEIFFIETACREQS